MRYGPLLDRLWSRIEVREPDECWPWGGNLNDYGYGRISSGGRGGSILMVHRLVYEQLVGPIPEGMTIDHKCHNNSGCMLGVDCPHRKCCNPQHMEPVPGVENLRRGTAGLRQKMRTHCPRNHEYSEENTLIKVCNGRPKRFCKECAKTYHLRRRK